MFQSSKRHRGYRRRSFQADNRLTLLVNVQPLRSCRSSNSIWMTNHKGGIFASRPFVFTGLKAGTDKELVMASACMEADIAANQSRWADTFVVLVLLAFMPRTRRAISAISLPAKHESLSPLTLRQLDGGCGGWPIITAKW
jgi:hypothetical protein